MRRYTETAKESRLAWVQKTGRALYGPEWPTPLSKALGVSSSLVRSWRAGTRHPSQADFDRVHDIIKAKLGVLRAALRASPAMDLVADAFDSPRVTLGPVTFSIAAAAPDPETAAVAARSKAKPLSDADRPKRRGRPPAVTEENIAKELGARGIRVFLAPPPRFNLTREQAAQERLDHAAGKVVYWSELMQHAHILQE